MPSVEDARARLKARAAKGAAGRVGGSRRVVKSAPKAVNADDKKVQSSLKRLGLNTIPGIEQLDMIKKDGTALSFKGPKSAAEATPSVMSQMSPEYLQSLLAKIGANAGGEGGAAAGGAAPADAAPADFEAVSED